MRRLLEKLDARQASLLLGGVVLLISAASVSLLVLPQLNKYRAALSTQAELPPAPSDSLQLQALLSERDAEIADKSRQLYGDMANLPVREIEAFVIERLQGISWKHDVVLKGVRPSAGETVDTFREVLLKVDLSGKYSDLYEWLVEMRQELGFVVIKDFRMNREDADQDDPVLNVQLTIAAYRKEAA